MEEIRKQTIAYYEKEKAEGRIKDHTAKTARWQRIKEDKKGNAYVTRYGTKFFVHEFMYDTKREHAYCFESICSALEIVLSRCGSYALIVWSRA